MWLEGAGQVAGVFECKRAIMGTHVMAKKYWAFLEFTGKLLWSRSFTRLLPEIMTSVLKAQEKNSLKADAKGKRKADAMDVDEPPFQKRPRNKQRVLLLSSRGINHRMRHLMNDLEVLLPHVKKGLYNHQTFVSALARTND